MASTATHTSRAERIIALRKKHSEQDLNPTEVTEYCNLRKKMAAAGINTDCPAGMLIWYARIADNRAQVKKYCDILSSRHLDHKALKRAAGELRDVGINPNESLKQALGEINKNARTYASEQKKRFKRKKRFKQQRQTASKTVKRMPYRRLLA